MTSIFKNIECKKHEEISLIGGYAICVICGDCRNIAVEMKVPMRPLHYIILSEIRAEFPGFFNKNRTKFFYMEIFRYIYEKKVVRITIMGETRGGKSEEAQTIALNYCRIYNALFRRGHFKNIDADKMVLSEISLDAHHIHANQSNYLYHLRDETRAEKLIFGQIHVVDEDRDNPGGIGSFSEEMEIMNLNNIVAKFMQAELWVRPKRFQEVNAPYGLNCLIKDETNRMNWSLLYKIEMSSSGLREQNFLGWIGVKLHEDEALRKDYQLKKNEWIESELKGTINERSYRRVQAIEVMLKDENFTQYKIGKDGKVKWHHGVDSMKFLIEKAMMDQRIDQFNDTEIERIAHGARAIGEERIKSRMIT